ncbi:MAG: hypothetical protein J1E56_06985 [Ruminococcus sp.]|nr:hypothetical protein [Ruminococcus sp.]
MDELNAWTAFFTTGNVLDYLRYKSIQNSKDQGADTTLENTDEVQDDRADNKGAKYR